MDASQLDWLAERLADSLNVNPETARAVLANTPRPSTPNTQSPAYHATQEQKNILNLFAHDLVRSNHSNPQNNEANPSTSRRESEQQVGSSAKIPHKHTRVSRRSTTSEPTQQTSTSREAYIAACNAHIPRVRPIGRVLDSLNLQCLNLRHANLNDAALCTIAAALPDNQCLTILDLTDNAIGDVGAIELGFVLCSRRTSVTDVGLGQNRIKVQGALAITEALCTNAPLVAVSLASNKLGDLFGT
jgi:hypothetical protein